jgi:site-specific DNA recombinase
MEPPTRVIGYVRVSSEEQACEGVSLDAQADRVTAYCAAKGWQLGAIVRDEGRSAKDLKRPGLQGVLADVPRPKRRAWDVLLVTKLDRLTRSVADLGRLMADFKRGKVAFCSIAESVDTSTAAGALFLNIIGALAQWERETISEHTAGAMAHLKAQGKRVSGRAPYGFTFDAEGRVIPVLTEQHVLAEIRQLRGLGLSLGEVSEALAARGIVNRCGRPFARQALHRMGKAC